MGMEALIVVILASLFLYFLLRIVKFFYKVWWYPKSLQKLLSSQGIKGPSYQLLHGSTKEALNMTRESMKSPMKLTHNILPRVQPHIHLWTKLYGRNFLSWHGYQAQLVVTEPHLIKEVLTDKTGVYQKAKPDDIAKNLFGDGLVMARGTKWSKQRKLANHAFHIENLKGMVPTMIGSVENMLQRWENRESKEIEVLNEFRVLTSDVIAKTAFGSNYLEGQKTFDMLKKLTSIIAGNTLKIRLPLIGKILKNTDSRAAEKLKHEIRKSFEQIIRRRKEKLETSEADGYGSDYLGLLLNANQSNDENQRISIDDVIDECKTFYFAGHETTMSLLTWTMFLLAIHTDWQEKARKEVFDIFGEKHPYTEDNSFAKMKTMTMIINETLRLYPPAPLVRRSVTCQTRLGEILLPQGIEVIIPNLVSHGDPRIWGEDVHLFKPDRFAEGLTKAAKNTSAYLPFSMGPRICVGSNFASIEVKLTLSMILQRYAFTLSPSYVHSPFLHIFVCPQHGVQLNFHAL
ncbi:Cytochrome p450 [Thalictrum thalictroides]|uniref:Cytochrome p450 n=1 Tax=Thalictrum thalictroides TaxID=46969 RepID=A0A7J6VYS2_THATH|nr:Cytochrome p450 [Thalictrum thalictroides]